MERTALMFAGQGAQYSGMGAEIAEKSPAAKHIFQEADRILGFSISSICFTGTLEDLTPCRICQPAIFTVSRAMRAAYQEEHPDFSGTVCGGLSLGEFSAACEANIFDFETALKLVAERGRLMDKCCHDYPGGMVAVLGYEDMDALRALCENAGIDIANYNCPGQVVISGNAKGLAEVSQILEGQGHRIAPLSVAGAYHSRLMQSAADAFGELLDKTHFNAPNMVFLQNVTGQPESEPDRIRENLRLQVASSVRWQQCATYMTENTQCALEFGPGNVLTKFMRRIKRGYPSDAPFFVQI